METYSYKLGAKLLIEMTCGRSENEAKPEFYYKVVWYHPTTSIESQHLEDTGYPPTEMDLISISPNSDCHIYLNAVASTLLSKYLSLQENPS